MCCLLIFVMVLSGESGRSKRVKYIILLLGNLVEASVPKAQISETKSSLASDYLSPIDFVCS